MIWVDVLDGGITVISLGFYLPNFTQKIETEIMVSDESV